MGRAIKIIFCIGLLAAGPVSSTELVQLPGTRVEELLELARQQSPELAAMRLEADAAVERVYPAGALPDPVLRTELMNITNRGMDKSPSLLPSQVGSTRYTFMQSVPWFGKRGLKRDAAMAAAGQAQGRITATWAELAMQIKSAYAQYYYVAGNQKITLELLELLAQMENIAQVRYTNGLAAQQDAVRAQAEQTAMKTELIMLGSTRQQVEAQLNALLSRQVSMPFAEPQTLRNIPVAARQENRQELESRIREHNPDLFVDEAGISAAEKNRELAYKGRYPDFTLGLSPTQFGSAAPEWGLMVELNIPLQQESRRSQERESEAMVAAAKARKEATANRILSALAGSLAGLDAAQRTETLSTSGLLPQARIAFESALAGYQTGKVDFAAVLDAAQQILNARREVLKAQADAQVRLAEIERLLGEEL